VRGIEARIRRLEQQKRVRPDGSGPLGLRSEAVGMLDDLIAECLHAFVRVLSGTVWPDPVATRPTLWPGEPEQPVCPMAGRYLEPHWDPEFDALLGEARGVFRDRWDPAISDLADYPEDHPVMKAADRVIGYIDDALADGRWEVAA